MIKNITPLNLVEVREFAVDIGKESKKGKEEAEEDSSNAKKIVQFAKKFSKLKKEEAEKLKKEVNALGILKIKPIYLEKVVEILPKDADDVRKIFTDVNLDQNEISQIIEVVKKYI